MNPVMTSTGDSGQRELLRCGVQLIYQAFDLNRQLHELNFQSQELAARLALAVDSEHEMREVTWQREQVANLQAELGSADRGRVTTHPATQDRDVKIGFGHWD